MKFISEITSRFSTAGSSRALLTMAVGLSLSACSFDVLPVHSARVRSAKMAEQPTLRGPNAPGAFQYNWDFASEKGFLVDPTAVIHAGGGMKLAPPPASPPPGVPRQTVVVTTSGPAFVALDSFSETPTSPVAGRLAYQLSRDASMWFYHNGTHWVTAGPTANQANSAAQIQAAIAKFHEEVGTGSLYVKAFLIAPTGSEAVGLSKLHVQGIAPRMDGFD